MQFISLLFDTYINKRKKKTFFIKNHNVIVFKKKNSKCFYPKIVHCISMSKITSSGKSAITNYFKRILLPLKAYSHGCS